MSASTALVVMDTLICQGSGFSRGMEYCCICFTASFTVETERATGGIALHLRLIRKLLFIAQAKI